MNKRRMCSVRMEQLVDRLRDVVVSSRDFFFIFEWEQSETQGAYVLLSNSAKHPGKFFLFR